MRHLRSCDGTCRIRWDAPRRSCTPSARSAPGRSRWSLVAGGRCSCSWWAPGSWSSGTVRCRAGSDAAARCSTWRCHRLWADENPSSTDSNFPNVSSLFKCDCCIQTRLCDCSSVQLGRGLCRHRNTTCLYSIYWLGFSSAGVSMHTLRVSARVEPEYIYSGFVQRVWGFMYFKKLKHTSDNIVPVHFPWCTNNLGSMLDTFSSVRFRSPVLFMCLFWIDQFRLEIQSVCRPSVFFVIRSSRWLACTCYLLASDVHVHVGTIFDVPRIWSFYLIVLKLLC